MCRVSQFKVQRADPLPPQTQALRIYFRYRQQKDHWTGSSVAPNVLFCHWISFLLLPLCSLVSWNHCCWKQTQRLRNWRRRFLPGDSPKLELGCWMIFQFGICPAVQLILLKFASKNSLFYLMKLLWCHTFHL